MDVEGSDRDVFRGTVPSNVTEGAEKTPKTSVKVVSVPAEIRIFHLPQVPPQRTLSIFTKDCNNKPTALHLL
jgi:hypothetical protein